MSEWKAERTRRQAAVHTSARGLSEFVREEMIYCAELIHQEDDPDSHDLVQAQISEMRWSLQDPRCNPSLWALERRKVMADYLARRVYVYETNAQLAAADGDGGAEDAFARDGKALRQWVSKLRRDS